MLRALAARYVFPVASPPIEDGVVLIDGDRIMEVAPAKQLTTRCAIEDLGNVAILPGLVNAHTHLEFSDLEQPLGAPGMAFPDWIRAMIAHRQNASPDMARKREAIAHGLQEAARCGSTSLGEIATTPTAYEPFRDVPLRGVMFLESLGLSDERIAEGIVRSSDHVRSPRVASRWIRGVSPHAPYSTHWQLVAALCGAPVAMHLAESREELELLQGRSGAFRQLLEDLGIWRADAFPRRARVMWYLKQLARSPRALVIHGNYLDDEEINFIAACEGNMSVVYCPRTHAYFQHEPYPLAKMLAAGVNVALGTDSRASNPDLDLLAEMQHVARQQDMPRETVLRMGTLHGAQALGLAAEIGTLERGKRADLAIVALPERDAPDPHELVLDSQSRDIATYCGGVAVALQ